MILYRAQGPTDCLLSVKTMCERMTFIPAELRGPGESVTRCTEAVLVEQRLTDAACVGCSLRLSPICSFRVLKWAPPNHWYDAVWKKWASYANIKTAQGKLRAQRAERLGSNRQLNLLFPRHPCLREMPAKFNLLLVQLVRRGNIWILTSLLLLFPFVLPLSSTFPDDPIACLLLTKPLVTY